MHIEVVLFFSECRPLATPIEVSRRCEYSAPLKNQATFKCLTSYSSVLKCHSVFIRPECSVGCSLPDVIRSWFLFGWSCVCLKKWGKGLGNFSCLQGAAVALFPCLEIQKSLRHGVCFLVCTSSVFCPFVESFC